ncbi:YdbH domain-containing protein [uncultured Marinobacter sp.]|uniref:YdbH domain-containing protein n=1 Tax=uncultured Marinobacter sp. TaxID=187379 RepID=UPI0030DB1D24
MTRRRVPLLVTIAVLLLLAVGSSLWLRSWWAGWLEAQGIVQLDWTGLELSFAGVRPGSVQLGAVTVERESAGQRLRLEGLNLTAGLGWQSWRPTLQNLRVEELQVDYWPPEQAQEQPMAPPDEPLSAMFSEQDLPLWLPEHLQIDQLRLNLPCRAGRCALSGSVDISRAGSLLPLNVNLTLDDPAHPMRLVAQADGQWPQQVRLDTRLEAEGEPLVTLISDWRPSENLLPARVHWQGRLEAPELPQADWLLERLSNWFDLPANPLPDQPDAGVLALQWELDWPQSVSDQPAVHLLRHPDLKGDVRLQAQLPQPWPIPGVATVQGNLALDLNADGRWLARAAQGRLRLTGLGGWINAVPEALRPRALEISLTPAELLPRPSGHAGMLPLRLAVTTEGAQPLRLESHLAVATRAPWQLQLGRTRLRGQMPGWQAGDWRLQTLRADLVVSGTADLDGLQLTVERGSVLEIAHLDPAEGSAIADLWLDGLSWQPEGVTLKAAYSLAGERRQLDQLTVAGPVQLSARSIRHPLLKTQSWRLQGKGSASTSQIELDVQLRPASGGPLAMVLNWPLSGPLALDISGGWQGKSGSDALAGVLTSWPSLLTFDQGTMTTDITLRKSPGDVPLSLSGKLAFDQLSGVYDRMAWTGLTGQLPFSLAQNQLQVETTDLTLAQVNPGIAAGPLTLSASYQAPIGSPASGTVELRRVDASLLGGNLVVEPRRWSMAELPVIIPVQIRQLELSSLLTAYPMEGLAGTGTLSGYLPLRLGSDGIAIERGRVTAEAPGGTLVFPSDRLRAIAQSNPTMDLVAQAMENFRYSVLNSAIDYDESGTLQLGLNLEGSNPEVQQGQVVRLNITIEENIPDLLTSLQLSGKVNEAVTERVRKMLQEQGRTAPEP